VLVTFWARRTLRICFVLLPCHFRRGSGAGVAASRSICYSPVRISVHDDAARQDQWAPIGLQSSLTDRSIAASRSSLRTTTDATTGCASKLLLLLLEWHRAASLSHCIVVATSVGKINAYVRRIDEAAMMEAIPKRGRGPVPFISVARGWIDWKARSLVTIYFIALITKAQSLLLYDHVLIVVAEESGSSSSQAGRNIVRLHFGCALFARSFRGIVRIEQ